jgi:hypothetical protein
MLAICLLAGLAEMFSSTLKMEAICSSETSVASEQTSRRHVSEDDTLQVKVIHLRFFVAIREEL